MSVCARVSTKPTRAYARERLYAHPTYVYLLVRRSYQEHRISQYMQQSLYTCLNINCRSRCGISCQAPALKAPSKSTPPLSIVVQSCSLHLEVISTLCPLLSAISAGRSNQRPKNVSMLEGFVSARDSWIPFRDRHGNWCVRECVKECIEEYRMQE